MDTMMVHEDFIETFFVTENKKLICEALSCDTLDEALALFEDTRLESEVNNMLELLQVVTIDLYAWSDENEHYYSVKH